VSSNSISANNPKALPVVISTTASSVNAQSTFSVPSSVADGRMIQQTTNNVQPPRLHPKKRKFDPTELEEENQQKQQPSTPSYVVATSVCNNPTMTMPVSTMIVHQRSVEESQNGNGSHQNVTFNNPTMVVRNSGEVIKKQFTNYR
jgi:hypothetical protein